LQFYPAGGPKFHLELIGMVHPSVNLSFEEIKGSLKTTQFLEHY